ncbi:MAG: EamA family transporter [Candidatus Zixiibacteriota bacterium]
MTYFIYTILSLIWGSTWLVIKIGLEDSSPLWSSGLRFVIAGGLIFLYNRIRGIHYPHKFSEILKIALPGFFIYSFSYMFVYLAEAYISSSLTAFLFASFPFFVAGFSLFMLKDERLGFVGWIGLLIGFTGIFFIFFDSLTQSKLVSIGIILAVLGAMAAAYGTVYIRARLREYPAPLMVEIQMLAGVALIIIAALIFEPINSFQITTKSISALLYLAIFGSFIAFLGYYWLLKRMEAIKVAQVAFINPFVAFILGYLVRYETFNFFTIIGSMLIIGGVIMVVRK